MSDEPIARGYRAFVARIGVDLNPLDVTDPDDRDWLRALVWPGPARAHRPHGGRVDWLPGQ